MKMLTDKDKMPMGKYYGEQLGNVPDEYLLFCFNNGYFDNHSSVKAYCIHNLDAIKKNVAKNFPAN